MRFRECWVYGVVIIVGLLLFGVSGSGIGTSLQGLGNSPWAVGVAVALLVLGFVKYQFDGLKPAVRARRRAQRQKEQDHYDEVTQQNMRRRR